MILNRTQQSAFTFELRKQFVQQRRYGSFTVGAGNAYQFHFFGWLAIEIVRHVTRCRSAIFNLYVGNTFFFFFGHHLADDSHRAIFYRSVNELMTIRRYSFNGNECASRLHFPRIDLQILYDGGSASIHRADVHFK
jgi:hypothetical protein